MSLFFNVGEKLYEVSLTRDKSDTSASFGGIEYSIQGDGEAVTIFKKKIEEMHLEQIPIENLQEYIFLQGLDSKGKVTTQVGTEILRQHPAPTEKTKEQQAVEEELIPTLPPVGSSHLKLIDRMKLLGIQGVSIAVINEGEKAWSAGYGEFEKPVFIQAASLSKTITAMTIMSLIDNLSYDKPLTLETNVRDLFDPDYLDLWKSISNGVDSITLKELMSHTAGLEKDTGLGFSGYDRKSNDLPSLDQILLGKNTNSPPVRVTGIPGTAFAYSGGGAMILQKIIEITTGKKFEEVVEKNIFSKLKMKNSRFILSDEEKKNTAQGYDSDCKPIAGKWMAQPELAAAGLWTTSDDLAKLIIGLQKSLTSNNPENVISQISAKAMITPAFDGEIEKLNDELERLKIDHAERRKIKTVERKLEEEPGLGLFIDKKGEVTYFFHSGSNLGFNCLMVGNDKGQGAVVMTNSDFGNELYPEIIRKIADVYGWEGKKSLRMFPSLHPEVIERKEFKTENWLKRYKGFYQNIDPTRSKGLLHLYQGKDGKIYLRTPDPSEQPFVVTPVSEHLGAFQRNNIGPFIPLQFNITTDGLIILPLGPWLHKKID